ncbi:hypothetical protein [Roseovarius sp. MBR-6]|jgi:hypothetical protein|uniref:hypothetical protein n=1 Tax=Roseovarius sp. MBR-6 TaxID=3156459 RepID=UPI003396619D
MKKTSSAVVLSAVIVSGCAGRDANPVQTIQEGDSGLSCSELRQEIEISSQNLSRLLGDQKEIQGKNTAAVVVGAVVFFPALFFMNLKGAAKEEAKALQDRINGLATRHDAKGCKPPIKIMTAEEAKAAQTAAKTTEE